MKTITLQANAKINIGLFVKSRRKDGFHELESFFQEIDFADKITLTKAESLSFSTDSDLLSAEDDNLCLRAARLLRDKAEISGVNIYLKKRIPIGAGLGGGSSDAAAVLNGLNRLFELEISLCELEDLAAKLGSDVPFFIRGGTARVSGRGEVIQPVSGRSDYIVVLVMPDVSIPTVWAYKNLKLGLTKKRDNIKLQGFELQQYPLSAFQEIFVNDFEDLVYEAYPELKEIKRQLRDAGAEYCSLSGSGSAIYGLFSDSHNVKKTKTYFENKNRVVLTNPVLYTSAGK